MISIISALRSLRRLPFAMAGYAARKRKERSCILGAGARLHPTSRIHNNQPKANIAIGPQSQVMCTLQTMGHGGLIEIGSSCFISENSYIWSATKVSIGDRTIISHGVNIHDTDSHSLSARSRHEHFVQIFSTGQPKMLEDVASSPISIGSDVWIGFGATILKGVTVGDGAVVGAQSVVTKDVPPMTVVVGNPAREVGKSRP